MVALAEQRRALLAERQDLDRHRRVVQVFAVAVPQVRSARLVGAVELFSQAAVLGVLHHGHVGGHVERDDPGPLLRRRVGVAARPGSLRRQSQCRFWQAVHLLASGEAYGEGFRRVEHVVGEIRGELRQSLLNLIESLFGSTSKSHS